MSESRPWFRLYTEFASDPKVQLLDETLQRRFVMLLCLAGAGVTPTSDVSEVDFVLRIGVSECERTRSILVSKGLIGDDWFPRKWTKRQFESDSSTERVKRFRKRQKDVTEDVTETASEQSRTEQNRAGEPLVLHESLPTPEWEEWLAHRREKRLSMSPRALKKQLKLLAKYDTESQRDIIDNSINAGWEGLFPLKGKPAKPVNGKNPYSGAI